MTTLAAGYDLRELLYESERTRVYRARRRDGLPVVLKTLRTEEPTAADVARLEREYQIGKRLGGEGAVAVLAFEGEGSRPVIVMEDFGASSLGAWLAGRRLDVGELLSLGVRIVECLRTVHGHGVVHRDVSPSNILVAPETGRVALADFGVSLVLAGGGESVAATLEGTLEYLSPEHTGRTGRALDHRADLYSLGATFHDLLTGAPPFEGTSPAELVYAHVARPPPSVRDARPDVPTALANLVLTLLSKTAEERYQSAAGLGADLEACLAEWRATGALRSFVPRSREVSDRFRIPDRLYGRARELSLLLSTFERASGGRVEMVLVSGASGVGKSALANELDATLGRRGGHLVAGKFDQLHRDVPYAPLIQALRKLGRKLLTGSEETLSRLRVELTGALGQSVGVVTEAVPELGLILGAPAAPVPALPPDQAQNRARFVFLRLVQTLATAEHPLALFLDDLQWADAASLDLFQLIACDPESKHLFLLGATRDDEPAAHHRLTLALQAIEDRGGAVATLALTPLGLDEVRALIADTLRCDAGAAEPLARLAIAKTHGNPFFLRQFLGSLHAERLIAFDPAELGFRWDMDRIREQDITENVVVLMAGKIRELPEEARRALELAACIGNEFSLGTLAVVRKQTPEEAARSLWPAVDEGLVLPTAADPDPALRAFKFLHDRVQQAAYSLLAEGERADVHLEIGRLLLASTPAAELDRRVFDVVGQYTLGAARISSDDERFVAAELCLRAGVRAKSSGAFEPALRYLTAGLHLLPEGTFEARHDLAFGLHVEAMQAELLNAGLERAKELASVALGHARTPLERTRILEATMLYHTSRNEVREGIDHAFRAIAELGLVLPPAASIDLARVGQAIAETVELLAGRTADDLDQLPEMTSKDQLALLRIMTAVAAPLYNASPLAFPVLACEMTKLCLRHGNGPLSAYVWTCWGLLQSDTRTACAFAGLALRLLARHGAVEITAKVHINVTNSIVHWRVHTRSTFEMTLEGIKSGLETGDFEFATHTANSYCKDLLYVGEPLEVVDRELGRCIQLIERVRNTFHLTFPRILRQVVENLSGRSAGDPRRLVGASFDEDRDVPGLVEASNITTLCLYHVYKSFLCYLFGDLEQAEAEALAAERNLGGVLGMNTTVQQAFYQALILLALGERREGEERARLLDKVEARLDQLRRWAADSPENHRHRVLLVDAERARADGRALEAMALYDEAIRAAAEARYVQDEALANERCAGLYLSLGRTRSAAVYLKEARGGYLRWGAGAKVAALEAAHPELFARAAGARHPVRRSITDQEGTDLDLHAAVKAARAISSEIELGKLTATLMRIVVENVGAQRGFFFVVRAGALTLEASLEGSGAEVTARPAPLARGEERLSMAIVHYVARTASSVVLRDAHAEGLFTGDAYVKRARPRSVLCAPLENQGRVMAVVYLENNLAADAFTEGRLELLRILLAQAALSIHNATLYESLRDSNERLEDYSRTLEQKVEERTGELSSRNQELSATLETLRRTQEALVTREKLASLGALTAGIAHELKNPLNFVCNFAELSSEMADEVAEALGPRDAEITETVRDLRENVVRISEHARRATGIINGMLLHARSGPSVRAETDLNALVARSVDLAYQTARTRDRSFQMDVRADYDAAVGQVEVAAAEMGRVFVNVIDNACYAMREKRRAQGPGYTPTLTLRTRRTGPRVEVRVGDNGVGIAREAAAKIFEPFFTTKPPGEGTGLGLSISHEMVVKLHEGEMRVESVPGEGAEIIVGLPSPLAIGALPPTPG